MSFNNMGKPIPNDRRDTAYQLLRDWGIDRDDAWSFTQRMAEQLEHDRPHEAMEVLTGKIDLTGAYRMMAVLLTDAP